MIEDGAAAPEFALPAVVDGELEQVALGDYLGREVVVLAFYPGDFNPACEDDRTGLDELDLFTMQKDVSVLACSTDSVYSHGAFAEAFDLHIPLLSDPGGEVAAEYGVTVGEPAEDGHLTRRAVVVIDLDGEVTYAWSTDSLRELPDVEAVRRAVEAVGGDRTAVARYGVGHAHYVEGRRTFTSAMDAFEEREWMLAENDFRGAEAEFDEAADEFNTTARFAEDEAAGTSAERAEEKARALRQAAEWLGDAATAYASGEGANAEAMRRDAERPLENARALSEPLDPDEFPPEEVPPAGDAGASAADAGEGDLTADPGSPGNAGAPAEGTDAADEAAADSGGTDTAAEGIDDAELEEITAELEAQTEQARARREGEDGDHAPGADAREVEGELDEDDIELDLKDPTAGDPDAPAPDEPADLEESAPEDEEGGDHGVPDSL